MKKLLIIGAGGHGKVVADAALKLLRWQEIGFLDDANVFDYPYKILGKINSLGKLSNEFQDVFIAIGNNRLRGELLSDAKSIGYELPNIIHPSAIVSDSVKIGEGTLICPNAVINPFAQIGNGCIINTAAIIEHDCIINDYVHVSPNAALAGGVEVGAYSWIGIGSNIIGTKKIGKHVVVGAGSVVINDIQDNVKVVGVPAKVIKNHE